MTKKTSAKLFGTIQSSVMLEIPKCMILTEQIFHVKFILKEKGVINERL
ncbi:MAG: hypothetical protein AB1298_02605 [Bacteroidota bacterium]